jgi:ammonia channel protein AmtB
MIIPMRVSESEESEGLDVSQHGESLDALPEEPHRPDAPTLRLVGA